MDQPGSAPIFPPKEDNGQAAPERKQRPHQCQPTPLNLDTPNPQCHEQLADGARTHRTPHVQSHPGNHPQPSAQATSSRHGKQEPKGTSSTSLPKDARPKIICRTGDKFTYNQNPLLINIASRTTRASPPPFALAPLAIRYLPKIFAAIALVVTSTVVQRIRQDLALGQDNPRSVSVAAPAVNHPVQTLLRTIQRITANPHATIADLVSYLQIADLLALTKAVEQRIAGIITDGIRYIFAPELLTSGQQADVISRLHATAATAGYTTAVKDTADLHRCPASLVLAKSGRLDIIAHTPMSPSHLLLDIWKFMSIPVRTDTGTLVNFELTTTLIAEARGGTGHFRAITADEWQDCQHFSTMTACHLPTSVDSDRQRQEGTNNAHFLHAIKTVQEHDIMRVCRIAKEPKKQVMVGIDVNSMIFFDFLI